MPVIQKPSKLRIKNSSAIQTTNYNALVFIYQNRRGVTSDSKEEKSKEVCSSWIYNASVILDSGSEPSVVSKSLTILTAPVAACLVRIYRSRPAMLPFSAYSVPNGLPAYTRRYLRAQSTIKAQPEPTTPAS